MKFICTILLSALCVNTAMAQKQYNQWYFGQNAGLNFNSGSPVPISNSALSTTEGSASIASATTGKLMFYTDGTYAYDTTNSVMSNSVSGMGGNISTTQSALIVPMPDSSTQYYVFTADAQVGLNSHGTKGISYNIIDMRLNGGLGNLTVVHQLLLTPATEKLTGMANCDGTYWVLCHQWNTNNFYAYHITSSGISAPVISSTGIINDSTGNTGYGETMGYMKFSPDGKKLAVAIGSDINTVQVFDFNSSTGVVSNPFSDTHFAKNPLAEPYGLSFSPDNSKLYVSYAGEPSLIYQYNLQAGDSTAIVNSRTVVGSYEYYFGALQIGPDNKLYVDRYEVDSIDVIENPNALGTACNYVPNFLYLGSYPIFTELGLPNNMWPASGTALSVSPSSPFVCSGQGVELVAGSSGNYTWSPATGLSATTGDSVLANPTATTTYTVTGGSCPGSDTVVVTINPAPNVPNITISVTGDSLISSAADYNQWFENDTIVKNGTSRVLVIKGRPKGFYKVVVTNPANGCTTVSDSTTGISSLSIITGQLTIEPNPFSTMVYIKINKAISNLNGSHLQVTNVLGQLVYTAQLNYSNEINLTAQPAGVYFVAIINKTNKTVYKVIKQ